MYETTNPDALAKQQKIVGLLEELLSETTTDEKNYDGGGPLKAKRK
jgi:hypothetical protein